MTKIGNNSGVEENRQESMPSKMSEKEAQPIDSINCQNEPK